MNRSEPEASRCIEVVVSGPAVAWGCAWCHMPGGPSSTCQEALVTQPGVAVTWSAGLLGDSCDLGVLAVFQLESSFWELRPASMDSGKGFLLWCVKPKFSTFSCNTG